VVQKLSNKPKAIRIDIITYWVPQDSVLGLILFVIYTNMNDLPRNIKTVKTILYADDTTIVQSSNNTDSFGSKIKFLIIIVDGHLE